MKKLTIILLALAFAGASSAQEYKLSQSDSQLSWKGYAEVGDFTQKGTIDAQSGTITLEDGNITAATVVVNMHTIASEEADLAKHLKDKDFFHVKKFSEATLTLKSIKDGKAQADLTIKGITLPVTVNVQTATEGNTFTVSGNLTIDRTKYGIKYNSSSYFQDLGSYAIKNEFDLAFVLSFQLSE